jgi:hypothetical protein
MARPDQRQTPGDASAPSARPQLSALLRSPDQSDDHKVPADRSARSDLKNAAARAPQAKALTVSNFRNIWDRAHGISQTAGALKIFLTPGLDTPGSGIEFTSKSLRYLVAFLGIAATVGHNSNYSGTFDLLLTKPAAYTLGVLFCSSFVLEAFGVQSTYRNRNDRLKQVDHINALTKNPLAWDSTPSDNKIFLVSGFGLIGVGSLFASGNIIESGVVLFILSLLYLAKFKFNSAMVDQPEALSAHSKQLMLNFAVALNIKGGAKDRFATLQQRLEDNCDFMTNDELTGVMALIQARYTMESIAAQDISLIDRQNGELQSVPLSDDSTTNGANPQTSASESFSATFQPLNDRRGAPPAYSAANSTYTSIWRDPQAKTFLMGPQEFKIQIQPALALLEKRLGKDAVELKEPPEVVQYFAPAR